MTTLKIVALEKSMFSKTLLKWYQLNKRALPWRDIDNPYYIWVSEIMLQQTQVSTVIPYFNRFIKALPDVYHLANVDDNTLMKLWEGLGYYSRARNLKISAKDIVNNHQGQIPNTYQELIKLKGIGPYTAGAILSMAFNKKAIAPDGNAYRVLTRYFGIKEDIRLTTTKQKLNELNKALLIKPYRDFTQSFMDFGSMVCKKAPLCERCPLKDSCYAYKHDLTLELPFISPLKEKEVKHYYTFVLKEHDQFILEQETADLLKGLYKYPQIEAESLAYAQEQLEEKGIKLLSIVGEKTYKHTFTHLIWQMHVIYGYAEVDKPYIKTTNLDDYPMPTAHKKIAYHRYFNSGK